MNKLNIFRSNKNQLISAIIIFLVYGIYLIIQNGDIHQVYHDSLDSNTVWHSVLKNHTDLINSPSDHIPNMMGGLDRHWYGSSLTFPRIFFLIFPPIIAYFLNLYLVKVIGFCGMYLLLSRYVFDKDNWYEHLNAVCISFLFVLLPQYVIHGTSVLGQPFLIYIFLNAYYRNKFSFFEFGLLIFLVLYTSLALTGVFIIGLLFLISMYLIIKEKFGHMVFLFYVIFFSLVYIIKDHGLFMQLFGIINEESHRSEILRSSLGFAETVREIQDLILKGQYHVGDRLELLVKSSFISILFLFVFYRRKILHKKILILLVALLFLENIFAGIYSSVLLDGLKDKIELLNSFQFDRVYFFNTTVKILIFSIISKNIIILFRDRKILQYIIFIPIFIILFQAKFVFRNIPEVEYFIDNYRGKTTSNLYTYNEFYSVKLFEEIKHFLEKDNNPVTDFRIVSLGIFPEISAYNGFYTIDGYCANYPLEYKHKFREIISEELAKNNEIKTYFDNWGSRCYLFSSELGKNFTIQKDDEIVIKALDLNMDVLHELNCKYMLSTVEIQDEKETGVKLLSSFTNKDSPWMIYVYEFQF